MNNIGLNKSLILVFLLLWLGGCVLPPSPRGGPPVVDYSVNRQIPVQRSTQPQPLPPPPQARPLPPPVEVNPITRPEPIVPKESMIPVVPTQPVPLDPELEDKKALQPPGPVDPARPTSPVQAATPVQPTQPKPVPKAPPAQISRQGNQAVVALLDSAAKYVDAGQLDKAGAALERALRIEPRNAGIWHDLAQIRLHQHNFKQAESLAEKSNRFSGKDRSLQARNWRLMAHARRAMGNSDSADAAEAKAVQLGG